MQPRVLKPEHEKTRLGAGLGFALILIAFFLPLFLMPNEESPIVNNIPQGKVPKSAEAPPPVETLVAFERFARDSHKREQGTSWLDSMDMDMDSVAEFLQKYTVFGFIYSNVDKDKVKDSFVELNEAQQELINKDSPQRARMADDTNQ